MTDETPRRFALRGWRTIVIGAVAGGTGIAALVVLYEPAPPQSRFAVTMETENAPTSVETDPLMAELLRCHSLAAGTDDAACRRAWEVNRRRFMGESGSTVPPVADAAEGR
jgi:conjugative transfer region protein TrbK